MRFRGPREPHMEHGGERPERQRPRRRRRGLDGPHAADEPVVPAELAIGRSDDEDVGHGPGRVGAAGILRGRRRRHSTSSPADRAAA